VADDAFERRIRIWEKPDGKPSAELYLGTSPRFQSSHVRVGGKDPVYEASGLSSYDVPSDAASWVDRTLLPVAADSVTGFGLSNHKGSFQLEKMNGRWSVKAPAARAKSNLDPQKVESLLRTVCGMSISSPAGPSNDAAYGLGAPEATVILTRMPAPGDTTGVHVGAVVLRVGAPVPGKEGERYAARSGFDYAVSIPKYSVDKVLDTAVADLLAK
jgi:hypothetical protein